MLKHLYKSLRDSFDSALTALDVGSRLVPKKDQPKQQAIIYGLSKIGAKYPFILIQAHDLENTFTCEVAVSGEPRFPWPSDCDLDESGLPLPACPTRCRLGFLCKPNKDYWWPTTSIVPPPPGAPSEILMKFLLLPMNESGFPADLVEKSVQDVITKIRVFGMPFIERASSMG